MELKKGNYVWWDNNQKNTLNGTITRIDPQTDKNGEIKKSEKGMNKYYLIVNDGVHDDLKVSIVESQRKFFDYKVGKYGTLTHDHTNNHLTFEEGGEPLYDTGGSKENEEVGSVDKCQTKLLDEAQIAMMFGQSPNKDKDNLAVAGMVGWIDEEIRITQTRLDMLLKIREELL